MSKQQIVKQYLLDCIDAENYTTVHGKPIVLENDLDKLLFLNDTFISEYDHEIRRYGKAKALEEWFRGMPSCFNLEFASHRILELAESWGYDVATERKANKFLASWFQVAAAKVLMMINKALDKVAAEHEAHCKGAQA